MLAIPDRIRSPDYLSPSLSRSIFLPQTITISVLIFPPVHGRHFLGGPAPCKRPQNFQIPNGHPQNIKNRTDSTKEVICFKVTNLLRKSSAGLWRRLDVEWLVVRKNTQKTFDRAFQHLSKDIFRNEIDPQTTG